MDGRSRMTGVRKRGQDATLLLVINGFHDVVEFIVPEWPEGAVWKLLIDTNVTHAGVEKQIEFGNTYQVTGRSLLVLLLQTA
jgi:isoamylase